MRQVLARLFFIQFTQASITLLLPLLLLEGAVGKEGFILGKLFDSLPLVVFGLIGGVLIDRCGAVRMNRIALALYTVPPSIILLTHFLAAPQHLLLLASLVLTCASYIAFVCSDRIVLELVPREELARYQAHAILIERLCLLLLPPLYGLIAVWSLDAAVLLTAASALVGAIVLHRLSPLGDTASFSAPAMSLKRQIANGFSSLFSNALLVKLAVLVMLVNAIEAVPIAYAFVYAREDLGMTMSEIGLLSSLGAAGGIAGALFSRSANRTREWLITAFVVSMFVNGALYVLTYLCASKYVLLGAKFVEGCSFVFSAVAYRTLRQDNIDKQAFGVVSGALAFTVKAGMPLSILIGGSLMLSFGAPVLYLGAGLLEATLGVVAFIWLHSQPKQGLVNP